MLLNFYTLVIDILDNPLYLIIRLFIITTININNLTVVNF